jgi:hypothetical protein
MALEHSPELEQAHHDLRDAYRRRDADAMRRLISSHPATVSPAPPRPSCACARVRARGVEAVFADEMAVWRDEGCEGCEAVRPAPLSVAQSRHPARMSRSPWIFGDGGPGVTLRGDERISLLRWQW